ncbi:MAG: hypothetical protein ACOY45_04505 [Pseudomonadota bacterium]
MTDRDHPAKTDDPLASQRAELLGKAVAAQFALEQALSELGSENGSALSQGQQHLRALKDFQRRIATADPASIAALRHDLSTMLATTHAAADQARSAAADARLESTVELAHLAAASRERVTSLLRDMSRFDPYLRFASPEDEAEYRAREAERRAAMETELAKGTPEGDLNAAAGAIGQMVDAKAHGAGDSPEFRERWDTLVADTQRLREAARANGVSTEEFDRRLRVDLRRVLKGKGLSDAQIDAQFAAHDGDPLEAAKAFVNGSDDIAMVRRSAERSNLSTEVATPDDHDTMSDLVASLQSAGVVGSADESSSAPNHGVTALLPATAPARAV